MGLCASLDLAQLEVLVEMRSADATPVSMTMLAPSPATDAGRPPATSR
jgi:hypothetical protein